MEREWTVDELVHRLGALGLRPGDVVMVHASLRRIGPVAGGAAGVIDALDRAVGPSGSLLMVLGAEDPWHWVNERPEPERAALLARAVPFDAQVTPAARDVGVLAEVFRRAPGTEVSDHPEGRFGARGPLAPHLASHQPWNDYYGRSSPLERFVEANGRVLRLGADADTVTVLHYAEHLAPVAGKRRVRRHRRVVTPDGPRVLVVETLDDEDGIVDHPGEDYFATILREFLATGRARTGRVGDAQSELFEATEIVEYGVRWMAEHLNTRAPWT